MVKPCPTGKIRHATQTGAIIALKKVNNRGLKSYRCPKCKGWHLANDRSQWKVQARIDQLLSANR